MLVTEEIGTRQLTDLIRQVQGGDEVLLTQDNKPVARLVSAVEKQSLPREPFRVRSINGHRVLSPALSQAELADEMFSRE